MSASKDIATERLYKEGVAAIRAGDKATGKEKLMEVVRRDQLYEEAWLWLSGVVDTDEERIICLENALTINPSNEAARRGLTRLGVKPPEPLFKETAKPESQAEPPSERMFATDMHAMLDGITPRQVETVRKDKTDEEAWRQAVYSKDYAPSESAAFVPPLERERHKRSLGDLTNTWGDMLWLNAADNFVDEIKYGGFGHVIVNILAASLLQMLSTFVLILLLGILPSERFQPPLLRSLTEIMAGTSPVETPQITNEELGNYGVMLEALGLDPLTQINAQIEQVGADAAAARLAVASVIGTVLFAYLLFSIPLIFISQMYYAIVANAVAGWLRGKGDAIQTMHAMTTAMVVVQIAQLPVSLVTVFLSFGTAFLIWMLLQAYQFVVAAVAIGKVHGFGLLLSMGVLLLSNTAASFLANCALFALVFLISGVGG